MIAVRSTSALAAIALLAAVPLASALALHEEPYDAALRTAGYLPLSAETSRSLQATVREAQAIEDEVSAAVSPHMPQPSVAVALPVAGKVLSVGVDRDRGEDGNILMRRTGFVDVVTPVSFKRETSVTRPLAPPPPVGSLIGTTEDRAQTPPPEERRAPAAALPAIEAPATAGAPSRDAPHARSLSREPASPPGARGALAAALPSVVVLLAIAVAAAMLVPLFSRLTARNVLDLPSRRAVYEHVGANPGATCASTSRALGMDRKLVAYHLRRLARAGLIERAGRSHFAAGAPRPASALAGVPPLARRIAETVTAAPAGLRLTEVSAAVGVSPQLAAYHLKKLLATGRVAADGARIERVYRAPS